MSIAIALKKPFPTTCRLSAAESIIYDTIRQCNTAESVKTEYREGERQIVSIVAIFISEIVKKFPFSKMVLFPGAAARYIIKAPIHRPVPVHSF
jgi:hypothetical protein